MTTDQEMLDHLTEQGRKHYDLLQKNLSLQCSMTDDEFRSAPFSATITDMFGQTDAEDFRAQARRTQDQLDQKGREAYAREYAATKIQNL